MAPTQATPPKKKHQVTLMRVRSGSLRVQIVLIGRRSNQTSIITQKMVRRNISRDRLIVCLKPAILTFMFQIADIGCVAKLVPSSWTSHSASRRATVIWRSHVLVCEWPIRR
jgi:hypothetical protein